ncbi:MAG: hypothetical protein AAF716_15655 [Cyanobacteria bacterium P01_D01_bin.1]
MSSAASRPTRSINESNSVVSSSVQTESKVEAKSDLKTGLRKPPGRSLLQPPARPKPPVRPAVQPAPPLAATKPPEPATPQRPGPISPPSEPRQYRAIGLLKGRYVPSEDQLNRGDILAEDGTLIDAVLLGRVTSLLKKHIDLGTEHLWVVYPRTLYKDELNKDGFNKNDSSKNGSSKNDSGKSEPKADIQPDTEQPDTEQPDAKQVDFEHIDSEQPPAKEQSSKDSVSGSPDVDEESRSDDDAEKVPALHVQIVGVWEPETLNTEAMEQPEETRPLSSKEAESLCDQFSIRGEVAKYSEESGEITVNIVQKSKSENTKPKRPFKLLVNGQLRGRATGYFWDLTVERQAGKLVLKEGKSIGVVPPKKKPKGHKGGKRRPSASRPPANRAKGSSSAPKPKPKPKVANATAEAAAE